MLQGSTVHIHLTPRSDNTRTCAHNRKKPTWRLTGVSVNVACEKARGGVCVRTLAWSRVDAGGDTKTQREHPHLGSHPITSPPRDRARGSVGSVLGDEGCVRRGACPGCVSRVCGRDASQAKSPFSSPSGIYSIASGKSKTVTLLVFIHFFPLTKTHPRSNIALLDKVSSG